MNSLLLSRTDNLGDVLLTLPLAAHLKKILPQVRIVFLGKRYTRPVLERCLAVDEIIDLEDFNENSLRKLQIDCVLHVFPNRAVAKICADAGLSMRVGTAHRLFHWWRCNRLLFFSRKNSQLHEAQLNFEFLRPLHPMAGAQAIPPQIGDLVGTVCFKGLPSEQKAELNPKKPTVFFHPCSKGSAAEWPLSSYLELIKERQHSYHFIMTGTLDDQKSLEKRCPELLCHPGVENLMGHTSLGDLINVIHARCDLFLSVSTGPIHLAALLNKRVVGLYPKERPMFAQRWSPLGTRVRCLSDWIQKDGLSGISVSQVSEQIEQLLLET